jgi:uncharacterized protein (TIGR02271 family)
MPAPTLDDVKTWRGRQVVGPDGEKVGKLQDIYLDRQSGEPEWAAVSTGLFGTRVSFVPLEGASAGGEEVRVAYDKETIKNAPNIDPDGELSPMEERQLYEHYGRSFGDWSDETEDRTEAVMGPDQRVGRGERFSGERDVDVDRDLQGDRDRFGDDPTTARPVGQSGTAEAREREAAGPAGEREGFAEGRERERESTDDAMTRSEEELRVGKTQRDTGRARLRKYVVTENVETTVPVQREEVRLEREPITDENREAAMRGPDITEREHVETLHAEEPVVEKEVVPKERVRLDKDVVTDEVEVSEELRKERIEPEGDAGLRDDDRSARS